MRRYGRFVDRRWIQQRMHAKDARIARAQAAREWYCGMCEQWFTKGGDCPRCGFTLEPLPRRNLNAVNGGAQ
jgi:uncharacterized paraquat-inducible protein A